MFYENLMFDQTTRTCINPIQLHKASSSFFVTDDPRLLCLVVCVADTADATFVAVYTLFVTLNGRKLTDSHSSARIFKVCLIYEAFWGQRYWD